jgi:hypothetical protein
MPLRIPPLRPSSLEVPLHLLFSALLLGGWNGPALAGSSTAESVWSRENALERARQGVPEGATITGDHCQEMEVGMDNYRYRCTVEYDPAATDGPTVP